MTKKTKSINNSNDIATNSSDKLQKNVYLEPSKLRLKEEQLEISKKRVQTGEVTVHKEISTVKKNIIVPVTIEELVIENKVFDKEDPNNVKTEAIRIPLSEEVIEIIKHPVSNQDVTIFRQELEEIEHIEEILKKEKIYIKNYLDTE